MVRCAQHRDRHETSNSDWESMHIASSPLHVVVAGETVMGLMSRLRLFVVKTDALFVQKGKEQQGRPMLLPAMTLKVMLIDVIYAMLTNVFVVATTLRALGEMTTIRV